MVLAIQGYSSPEATPRLLICVCVCVWTNKRHTHCLLLNRRHLHVKWKTLKFILFSIYSYFLDSCHWYYFCWVLLASIQAHVSIICLKMKLLWNQWSRTKHRRRVTEEFWQSHHFTRLQVTDCIFLDLSQAAIVVCHVHVSQHFQVSGLFAFIDLVFSLWTDDTKESKSKFEKNKTGWTKLGALRGDSHMASTSCHRHASL